MRGGSAVLVLFLLVGVPAFSSVIDFTGLTPGNGTGSALFPAGTKGAIVSNQFSALGVTFSTSSSPTSVAYVSSKPYVPSGPNTGNFLVMNTLSFGNPAGTLTVAFNGWVLGSTISFYITDTEFATSPKTVVTRDSSGNVLESWSLTSLEATHAFTLGQVNRIDFTDTGGDGFALDTLSFGAVNSDQFPSVQAVPEPGTLGLLGAGLAAMGLLFRRRRAG